MELLHVLTAASWETAQCQGVHAPAELTRDGFLHCCTESQLGYVLRRHFVGVTNLIVLTFETDGLDGDVQWVKSEPDQDPFPHLYGAIPIGQVRRSRPAEVVG